MQEIIFIFYARVFYTFSTVFNKVMNIVFIFAGKRIPNISKIVWIKKTDDYGDEPPDGGGV